MKNLGTPGKTTMTACNYLPFNAATLDRDSPLYQDLFDLDILSTEDGIFINIPTE